MAEEAGKITGEELAKLIDAVGDSEWHRYLRFTQQHYGIQGCLPVIVMVTFFGGLFICVTPWWLFGVLIAFVPIGVCIYYWQRSVFLQGDVEDAMRKADMETIAQSITLAKWEYVGYDAAKRVGSDGRKEIKKISVLRTYEPENIEKAYQATKSEPVSLHLEKALKDKELVEANCFGRGLGAAIACGLIEITLVRTFYPAFFEGEEFWKLHKHEVKGMFMVAAVVGMAVYAWQRSKTVTEHDKLRGLDEDDLKRLKLRNRKKNRAGKRPPGNS